MFEASTCDEFLLNTVVLNQLSVLRWSEGRTIVDESPMKSAWPKPSGAPLWY